MKADVFSVTLVSDTSILAAGDIIADFALIGNVTRIPGGQVKLVSLAVFDEDDQGTAIDFVFATDSDSLGTLNAVPSISDANSRDIVGVVSVAAADFSDLGGVKVANLGNIQKIMEAASNYTRLYVAAVCRSGTPTYTASGIKLKLGFEKY